MGASRDEWMNEQTRIVGYASWVRRRIAFIMRGSGEIAMNRNTLSCLHYWGSPTNNALHLRCPITCLMHAVYESRHCDRRHTKRHSYVTAILLNVSLNYKPLTL